MNKSIIFWLFLTSALILDGCVEQAITQGRTSTQKAPFGLLPFEVNDSFDVKEVSFSVIKKGYAGISVTDCMDYLRENYETPLSWKDFEYYCVMDSVLTNFEELSKSRDPNWWMNFQIIADCRCEYAPKTI